MKLIVYKSFHHKLAYHHELLDNIKVPYIKSSSNFPIKGIAWVVAESKPLDVLRGLQRPDEVLWVGFRDCVEVAGKAPVDLLAQLHWNDPIYHFCNPPLA